MSNDEPQRPAFVLQNHLRGIDQAVRMTNTTNKEQLSICALAAALALKRYLVAARVHGKPLTKSERRSAIRAAVADFENKLNEFGGEC